MDVLSGAAPRRLSDDPALPGLLWAMRFDEGGRGHCVDGGEPPLHPGAFGEGFTWLHFNLNDARLPGLIAGGRLGPPQCCGTPIPVNDHKTVGLAATCIAPVFEQAFQNYHSLRRNNSFQ